MTLVELRYLIALAQEQHFRRAAALCSVSQPALSIAVKKLEDELGVALFERSKSQVRLTALGEAIAAQARKVLKSSEHIQAIAEAGLNQLGSALAVGAIPTIGPYLLPEAASHLAKSAPQMPLIIHEAREAELRQNLRRGELDAIVVSAPFVEADVVSQELFAEPLVVLLPRRHALAAKVELQAAELTDQVVLLLEEGDCLRKQVLAICPHLNGATGMDERTTTVGSLVMLRNLVSNNLGITILPLSAATDLCAGFDSVVIRNFTAPRPVRTLLLAWRASFPRHKAVDALRTALQSCSASYGYYTTDRESRESGVLVENSRW